MSTSDESGPNGAAQELAERAEIEQAMQVEPDVVSESVGPGRRDPLMRGRKDRRTDRAARASSALTSELSPRREGEYDTARRAVAPSGKALAIEGQQSDDSRRWKQLGAREARA
jgi:hypothetical protein